MRDRLATLGPIAAVAGALGLCCGLPVLLSLGVTGAVAGWSLQSWTLLSLGLLLAALEGPDPPTPEARPHVPPTSSGRLQYGSDRRAHMQRHRSLRHRQGDQPMSQHFDLIVIGAGAGRGCG